MRRNMIYKVMSLPADVQADVYRILMFTDLMKEHYNLEEKGKIVEDIRELGSYLQLSKQDEPDIYDVLCNAKESALNAVNEFNNGKARPEDWGLNWEEYLLFEAICNSSTISRLVVLYDEDSNTEMLKWCRDNAPHALWSAQDEEVLEYMKPAYDRLHKTV